jgi:hypothetical protein
MHNVYTCCVYIYIYMHAPFLVSGVGVQHYEGGRHARAVLRGFAVCQFPLHKERVADIKKEN